MQKQLAAELSVLDRMLYLLEEKSVQHVARSDDSFSNFIDQLYEEINYKAVALTARS